ncbi:efflux RND transporter periplasmic adaptor subunit [Flavobacterium sp. '19STA2R22 D10 B1']|uniref:efflux RND transporter periplasmic adaptor subunit n=1 Tax=Flavobacterium aerium TaxID=3037261 RepID=UPI00278C0EEE|nr:efflux RND transporter periplasmic adaptor subunit [Flavobacterium sp. '19STA2R22 D10 B1']
MRNIILSSIIILFIYGCAGDQAKNATPPPPSLPVLSIGNVSATTTNEFPAAIQGRVDIEVRPQVDGYLDKVLVDEGAYVTKGQALFKINELPYRELLNTALGNFHAAEAALVNAQLEVDKLTPLVENKVVSDYQLKAAKANYRIAKANTEQTRAMVNSAEINLGYTLIKATVNGYIGRLPKKQGSLVSRTDVEALTQLTDVQEVYAYFSLGENDFINFKTKYEGNTIDEKIKKLPPVSLILADGTPYTQTGKIDMVDGQFDKNTGAITLRATFPNAKGLLRSGNTGKIQLGLQHDAAILIPQSATIEIQDKTFVYAVGKDNKVSKMPITIGGISGTDYLITDGVKAGDRIVSKGFENLQEGTVITPQAEQKTIAKN